MEWRITSPAAEETLITKPTWRSYVSACSPTRPRCAWLLIRWAGADLHLLFDQRRFVLVPKISRSSPTPAYALAIHVLDNSDESGERSDLYQNATLQPEYARVISRECLFARFAWALFPFLRNFLDVPIRRRLAVITRTDAPADQARMRPRPRWMTHAEYRAHLHQRGESLNGSRKRRSSQISQDESGGVRDDDASTERRGRRSSPGQDAAQDRDERQLRDAAEWYEQHGRYARVESPDERQLGEGTAWYRKHGRFASVDGPDEDDWEDEASRGRLRGRGHTPEGWVSDDDDDDDNIPNLSRSWTTSSNRSSWLEPPGVDLAGSRAGPDKTSGGATTPKGLLESCEA